MSGRPEPYSRGDPRVGGVKPSPVGDVQERGLEARGVADREELLGVGACATSTAHVLGYRKIDFQATIRRPPVPFASPLDDCLGGVQNLHVLTLFSRSDFSTYPTS
jgi:hypothetical protein